MSHSESKNDPNSLRDRVLTSESDAQLRGEPRSESSVSKEFIEVPIDQLPQETLLAIAKEFVEREATDYGQRDIDQESKIESVMKQIRSGKVHIVFSLEDESLNLLTHFQFSELEKKGEE